LTTSRSNGWLVSDETCLYANDMKFKSLLCFLATLSFLIPRGDGASAARPLEGGVDPQRVEQISAMLGAQPFAFGPKIADRAAWQRLAATRPFAKAVKDAEQTLASPKIGRAHV